MKRKGLIALGVGAALLLLLGFVVLREWDSPALGAALLERVGAASDLDIQAQGFRLQLLRGLVLDQVRVFGSLSDGELSATADRAVFRHRLGPLLRGRVVVDEILLQSPLLELSPGSRQRDGVAAVDEAGGAPAKPEATASRRERRQLEIEVGRFAISDGRLILGGGAQAEAPTEIEGLDLELRELRTWPQAASLLAGLEAVGTLSAETLKTSSLVATDIEGEVRVSQGRLLLDGLDLETELGEIGFPKLALELSGRQHFELDLEGDPLRTDRLLGLGDQRGLGPSRLRVDLAGDLAAEAAYQGRGALSILEGRLPESAVLRVVEQLLGLPLIDQEYASFDLGFAVGEGRLVPDPFAIVAGDLTLNIDGSLGLDDESLALRFVAEARRDAIDVEELPEELLEALTDARGMVRLPILVTGTRSRPSARFDRSAWSDQARERLESEVKKELGKALNRLLRRRDG